MTVRKPLSEEVPLSRTENEVQKEPCPEIKLPEKLTTDLLHLRE
jgi:hypothetical protein